MFDDAMGALDHIEDVTQNTESEDYGRIGTNSYKAAVDFIVPDTVDAQDAEAVSSYIDIVSNIISTMILTETEPDWMLRSSVQRLPKQV